jgi:hypothetical protein
MHVKHKKFGRFSLFYLSIATCGREGESKIINYYFLILITVFTCGWACHQVQERVFLSYGEQQEPYGHQQLPSLL